MKKEMICISCPIGCHLNVSWDEDKELELEQIKVEGNKCSRGITYGREEILSPKRVITATCSVDSIYMHRIPVKTTSAVNKEYMVDLLEEIYKLRIKTPIKTGDVLINNYKNTGVNIVATRSLNK
ncbi:MAG: hypothetical protein B6229_09955 [Spirochaetaceae bacterium 4572_7]|nr:MAG: hypothetical protein B6229_09955 [Spirochaetaceae bacterium 4572_7]